MATTSAWLCAALVCAGCPPEEKEQDEPHPLEGIYEVTTHTEASPCDAAAAAPDYPFTRFKLAEDSFFGSSFLGFFDCSDGQEGEELDDDGCSTSPQLTYSGFGPDDEVDITSCSCFDETCSVTGYDGGWQENDDGAALTLDRLSGEVPGTPADVEDCDPSELFDAHRDELACETQTVIEGARE